MKKILLATPTMHGEEQQYIQEAFETNWIAPLWTRLSARSHLTWERLHRQLFPPGRAGTV